VTTPACAGCGRHVTLKGASPQGRICSACTARRQQGLCSSCHRQGKLVGRDSNGRPWCGGCYSAAAADRVAQSRTAAIVAAVLTVEPQLAEATVVEVLEQTVGVRSLGRLDRHLQANPDALLTGPTSLPVVLDRFIRALVTAGAQHITVIHPNCMDCGRSQPVGHQLADGVLCAACKVRRVGKRTCAGCGLLQRPYSRDEAGNTRCQSCVQRARGNAEHTELLEQLTVVLAEQARVDDVTITGILAVLASQRHQLRVLLELLAAHRLTEPGLPFVLARLVIALRSVGADLPAPPCASCLQPTGPDVSLQGQRIRCHDCARRCPSCGKARRGDDQRPCRRCLIDPDRRRDSCAGCQQPDRLLDEGLCRWCRELAQRSCADCHLNRALSAIDGRSLCQPCALRRTVDELLPEQPPGALHALRIAILAAEAMTTRRWLRRPEVASLLADLDTGRKPLTHQTLNEQPPSRAVEHLRGLLIATGELPDDPDRLLRRFHDDSEKSLSAVETNDARIVRSWLRWHVLPRLRRHLDGPVDLRVAISNATRTRGQIMVFLTQLHDTQRTLTDCEQRDLDSWFSTSKAARHQIRPFLVWAQHTQRLPRTLTLPPSYQARSQPPIDPEERWRLARRLVHDDTLDTADRVAGALVVLYAQPLVRICALTTNDVQTDGKTFTIGLGTDRLELPEPFATLITSLPQRRRAGVAEQLPSNWLFPGSRAGRPLGAVALGQRLRAIGIEPRRMRQAAIEQLTKEMPPAMLTGILGFKTPQTVRRTSQAGGDWAKYAASRSTT
jgi:hypothetical protein